MVAVALGNPGKPPDMGAPEAGLVVLSDAPGLMYSSSNGKAAVTMQELSPVSS